MIVEFICEECAILGGGKIPKDHLACWHIGKCDACSTKKLVTEPRDFGYPKIIRCRRQRFVQSLNTLDHNDDLIQI